MGMSVSIKDEKKKNEQVKKRKRRSQMENEECQERICIDGQRWFACGCQDASKSQRNSAVPRPRHKAQGMDGQHKDRKTL
jgi:hypothetical protein